MAYRTLGGGHKRPGAAKAKPGLKEEDEMGETTGVLLEPKRTAGGLKWLREHKDAALPVIHAAGGADGKWGCDADKHVAKVLGAFAAKDGRTISYRSVEAFRHENGMKSFECKPRKTSETTPGAAYDKMCEVTAPHDAKRNRENFDNFCTDLSAMLGKRRLTPDEIKAECERRRPWVEFVVGDTPVIAHLVSVKGQHSPVFVTTQHPVNQRSFLIVTHSLAIPWLYLTPSKTPLTRSSPKSTSCWR